MLKSNNYRINNQEMAKEKIEELICLLSEFSAQEKNPDKRKECQRLIVDLEKCQDKIFQISS